MTQISSTAVNIIHFFFTAFLLSFWHNKILWYCRYVSAEKNVRLGTEAHSRGLRSPERKSRSIKFIFLLKSIAARDVYSWAEEVCLEASRGIECGYLEIE